MENKVEIQFLQAKDFLKLGFTESISTCKNTAWKLKKKLQVPKLHYTEVAKHYGISEIEVLRRINSR